MNFHATAHVRREFELYAAQHGMSIVDLFQESFCPMKEDVRNESAVATIASPCESRHSPPCYLSADTESVPSTSRMQGLYTTTSRRGDGSRHRPPAKRSVA